uniref:Apple domain-containing protein n=2 Tax=Caenorhabditis japonica TaxID=281687 RepID=A0A8R1DYW1_CAEJA
MLQHTNRCAKECIEDFSCFGYEWNSEEKVCYLKSRSTSGKLVPKHNTMVGFCQDDEDEVRYRLQDHVIVGPVILEADDVPDGEECKDNCRKIGAPYYSWRPKEVEISNVVPTDEEEEEEEPERLGKCACISTINEIRLEYDAFSGFIPIPKHKHRRSIYFRAFEI